NGAGKSTLLGLLAGALSPTQGVVRCEPAEGRLVLCRQTLAEPSVELIAFAYSWEGSARRARARLGLDPEQLERWGSLSPGERQRWQLAAALELEPQLLLLDEPTNHLDAGAREALAAALREF